MNEQAMSVLEGRTSKAQGQCISAPWFLLSSFTLSFTDSWLLLYPTARACMSVRGLSGLLSWSAWKFMPLQGLPLSGDWWVWWAHEHKYLGFLVPLQENSGCDLACPQSSPAELSQSYPLQGLALASGPHVATFLCLCHFSIPFLALPENTS